MFMGVTNLIAQNVVWSKNSGHAKSSYSSVIAVPDGIIAVGNASLSHVPGLNNGEWLGSIGKGGEDAIIIKFDNSGNVIWKKNFGGVGNEYFNHVIEMQDGFVACGYADFKSFGTGDLVGLVGKGGTDIIFVKFDNSGNVVWKKNFGGSTDDSFNDNALVWDGFVDVSVVSGGFVAVGARKSFDSGDWEGLTRKGKVDALIVKFDSTGNVLWKKNFGGKGNNTFTSVTVVSDGIVAVGTSSGYGSGGGESFGTEDLERIAEKGLQDAIIVKYDNSGNIMWKKNFGGYADDEFKSVTAVADGIVTVGFSDPNSFNNGDWEGVHGYKGSNAIAVKYDNNGNIVWKKNCCSEWGEKYNLIASVSNGFVVRGFVKGTLCIEKHNAKWDIVWSKSFGSGSDNWINCIAAVQDGVVVVGGSKSEGARIIKYK